MNEDGEATLPSEPDTRVSVRERFGVDVDDTVAAFSLPSEHVPELDPHYRFDPTVCMALLAGFDADQRVLVQGPHGTGKSSHVEQVAARLNWPCLRINLDGHVGRIDLLGKDAIVLRDGLQVTEFREGLLPWAFQRPVALVFDEYDAGRPDVMFVIQRVLEQDGRLTLLERNRVLRPHPFFRLFATSNTVGLGDLSGAYHGTQQLNQAQLDRWNVIARLDYLPETEEVAMIAAKAPWIEDRTLIERMVRMAAMTRVGFKAGDVSVVMSPRTVLSWASGVHRFGDVEAAFELAFLNRCDEDEKPLFAEYYQRCLDVELGAAPAERWRRVERVARPS